MIGQGRTPDRNTDIPAPSGENHILPDEGTGSIHLKEACGGDGQFQGPKFGLHGCTGKDGSMPKMKSKRSAKKRFKLTASGRVKRGKAFASHLLKGKTTKRKRNYRRPAMLTKADENRIKEMIL